MDTKACVYCGCDVTCDDSIASYMEFPSDEAYVDALPFDRDFMTFNKFVTKTWWIHAHIPPRNTYADIYALCLDCTEHVLAGETFIPIEALIPYEDAWDKLDQ